MLNHNITAYVYVGSQGTVNNSVAYADQYSFNGGGLGGGGRDAYNDNTGGGGATHIALISGELKSLSAQVDKVLIVAGGGRGSYGYNYTDNSYSNRWSGNGGHGGGYQGNTGQYAGKYYWLGYGGSQTTGGTTVANPTFSGADGYPTQKIYYDGHFGEGGTNHEDASGGNGAGSGGGGGGGYYGGAHSHYAGGGGGSGYIGNSLF